HSRHLDQRLDMARVEPQGLREAAPGFIELLQPQMGRPAIGPRIGVAGVERDRFLVELDRLLRISEMLPDIAEIVERRQISRLQRQRPPIRRAGILIALELEQGDAMVAMRLGRAWIDLGGAPQRRLGLLLLAGVELAETEQPKRVEM